LTVAKPYSADGIAGLVSIAVRELELDLLGPDLLELVEHAEDVFGPVCADGRVLQQEVEDFPAGKPHLVRPDVDGAERVADGGDDLGVGRAAGCADRIKVELGELPVASRVGLVGPPHLGDLVAPERQRDLRVLAHDPGKRDREVKA